MQHVHKSAQNVELSTSEYLWLKSSRDKYFYSIPVMTLPIGNSKDSYTFIVLDPTVYLPDE